MRGSAPHDARIKAARFELRADQRLESRRAERSSHSRSAPRSSNWAFVSPSGGRRAREWARSTSTHVAGKRRRGHVRQSEVEHDEVRPFGSGDVVPSRPVAPRGRGWPQTQCVTDTRPDLWLVVDDENGRPSHTASMGQEPASELVFAARSSVKTKAADRDNGKPRLRHDRLLAF